MNNAQCFLPPMNRQYVIQVGYGKSLPHLLLPILWSTGLRWTSIYFGPRTLQNHRKDIQCKGNGSGFITRSPTWARSGFLTAPVAANPKSIFEPCWSLTAH